MPEWLNELLANPNSVYLAVGTLFVLCGLGLPLPEEIILVSAGYLCYQGSATYPIMTLVCAGSILVGDIIPFLLGTLFGPRLLRLKWLRIVVSRERLAVFNRWFRRRGDLVILVARFIPGLRVVAFFTGGTMRMRWSRFLILDTIGIALTAPTFTFIGWHFGDKIDEAFRRVRQVEDSILYLALVGAVAFGLWYGLRRRARRRRLVAGPQETFVEPSPPRQDDSAATSDNSATTADDSSADASSNSTAEGEEPAEPGVSIPQPESAGGDAPAAPPGGERDAESRPFDDEDPAPGPVRGSGDADS